MPVLQTIKTIDANGNEVLSSAYAEVPENKLSYDEMRELMSLKNQLASGNVPDEVSCKVTPTTGDALEDFSDASVNVINSLKSSKNESES